jgi:hypothetical protein
MFVVSAHTSKYVNMIANWDIAPCSLEVDRRFRGTSCLRDQGDDGSSKLMWNIGQLLRDYTALYPVATIFILAAMNLSSYLLFF